MTDEGHDDIDRWVDRLSKSVERGDIVDLAVGLASDSDERNPATADKWANSRHIPAAALRALLIKRGLDVDPHGVRIRGARITGPVDLENVRFEHALHLYSCRVDQHIDLSGAKLEELVLDGSHIGSLYLDNASIAGGVFAREGFAVEVRAIAAKIGGQLALSGTTLTNPGGVALVLDSASIANGVFANGGFAATGEVRANGVKIGGQLALSGATLINPDGRALVLDSASIAGGVFAHEGFAATGEVRANGAEIGGQLALSGATLTNPDGRALVLDNASIAGGVFADAGFAATGEVGANGAEIGGQLALSGATLINPDGKALTLERATIATLFLKPERVEGTINLTRATITDLVTPQNEYPRGRLVATGWQIVDVHGWIRRDRTAAATWLKTTPRDGFTAQPWHALAAVYDRNGQPVDARRLRFAAANQTTKHAPLYSIPVRWMYMALAGHGYYPLFAVVWLVAALLVGLAVVASSREYVVPTNPAGAAEAAEAYATATGTRHPVKVTADVPCERYPGYPCFDSWTYTLAGVVPAATGVTRPDWTISPAAPRYLTTALPLLRILAWICTAILLAGVTGLLRKT